MAMGYEVRGEYRETPLIELLESTVMCFQGVGDTQNDILNRFFGVTTVGELANMPFFLSALGIQELALRQANNGQRPVSELAQQETLRFAARPEYMDYTAKDLLGSPVRVLDGLTPAQSLALYDGFRITTVVQLAHNRIMLEARIIEYLKRVQAGEIPEADMDQQISSILLSSAAVPLTGTAAVGESDLGAMTGDLHSHLRGRLDTLRERAREKAGEIASRPESSADERREEASRVRPDQAPDSRSRLDTIREMRQRGGAGADSSLGGRTTVASGRAAVMEEIRANRAGAAAGDTRSSTTPSRSGLSTSSSTPSRPTKAETAAAEAAATEVATVASEQAAQAAQEQLRAAQARKRITVPQMAIAAAALVVLIAGAIWLWVGSSEPPTAMNSGLQPGQSEPGSGATTQDGQPLDGQAGQGSQSDSLADSQAAGGGTVTGVGSGSESAAASGSRGTRSVLPIKSTHTVLWGQSLWRISKAYYKDPVLWPWIFRANENIISDPDLIYPDQQLDIPEVP